MTRIAARNAPKYVAMATCAAALLALNVVFAADPVKQQPSAGLVGLGMKFEGAAGCSNAKCHGSTTPAAAPKPAGNEYITWSEKDKHAQAYESLRKYDKDKMTADPNAIAKAMGMKEKPQESAMCVNCHALVAPAAQQMAKFNEKEGVTCGACHGPYEKWEKPHNVEGGANGLRKQAGYAVLEAQDMPYHTGSPEHQKLLKEFGLFDTRPVLARAEKCTSCHLAIDAKLIEAGHPQPIFELAYYTDLETPHWREPGGYWATKVWAAGQVICLRDAMNQLADRAADAGTSDKLLKDALNQAMGHLSVFRPLVGAGAGAQLDAKAADLASAGADKAKLGAAAKAVAEIAAKLAPAVGAMKPAEGTTTALLGKISGDATVTKAAGFRGAQQQALALSSLTNSLKKGKAAAGADDVLKMIDEKLLALVGDEASFKPDDFNANLKAVAGKLGPMLGGAGNVPDPLDAK